MISPKLWHIEGAQSAIIDIELKRKPRPPAGAFLLFNVFGTRSKPKVSRLKTLGLFRQGGGVLQMTATTNSTRPGHRQIQIRPSHLLRQQNNLPNMLLHMSHHLVDRIEHTHRTTLRMNDLHQPL